MLENFATLEQCQQWLDQQLQVGAGKSNERFLEKLLQLNWQKNNTKIFLVSGTNGKGSTCIFLESILQAAGLRTGCYLSPHVLKITERIRVDGVSVSDAQFIAAFNAVKTLYENEPIHWFEFMTVVAFAIFQQQAFDALIIEVGIGGHNDVTNALDPDISIVTSIGLDHQEILGNTRDEIAAQKCGIFRAHRSAICGDPQPPQVVLDYANEIDAHLLIQDRDFSFIQHKENWDWQMGNHELRNLPLPNLPLINASTAVAAIFACPFEAITEKAIRVGVIQANLPGRWQIIHQQPLVILDVAHNEHGFAYIAQRLKTLPSRGKTRVICAMQDRKNIEASLRVLTDSVDVWYLANLNSNDEFIKRAIHTLKQYPASINIAENLLISYKKAIADSTENDRIIVLGSFHTVEAILGELAHEY